MFFGPGLSSGLVSASNLGRSAFESRKHHPAPGPERPQPGEGHLETRGLLPQRQARRVPVRDCAQRAGAGESFRRDSLHAQVRFFQFI